MSKYSILEKILDELRSEAPIEYKVYYPLPGEQEKLNYARSRAYIHLFLKVKFGIASFAERELNITDGTDDGGLDGYYIDQENKKIYFIQSKFRSSATNFENKNIDLDELFAMELDRITKGERTSYNNVRFNNKVQKLIDEISTLGDYVKYSEEVVLLANLKDKHENKIRKLTLFPTEVFDYERCYNELIFPVVSGTFFNPKELKITIKLKGNTGANRIFYPVDTQIKECNITALFVPTIEIGKILYKYKNSILKYNPRSFLELAHGSVNRRIESSILEIGTNEFALYNNGITFLSDNTFYKDHVARRNEAEMILTNPQIINGGQTAFTLSRIYEDRLVRNESMEVFDGKEVLVKIITFEDESVTEHDENDKLELIEAISKATNDQTAVTEADRRSNEKIQINLQRYLFEKHGHFYERKKGEFADGLRQKYIDRSKIIDRETFLRICLSINGNPSQARRASVKQLFEKNSVKIILKDATSPEYFYGFIAYHLLGLVQKGFSKQKNNSFGQAQYGYGLRYGKLAMVGIISKKLRQLSNVSHDMIELKMNEVLNVWLNFEDTIKYMSTNVMYFRKYTDLETNQETIEVDFDNYYKGKTLANDLSSFFPHES